MTSLNKGIVVLVLGFVILIGINIITFATSILELDNRMMSIGIAFTKLPSNNNSKQYNKFVDIMSARDMRLYKNPGNNCYDQTKIVQTELEKIGIASSILIAKERTHAWLGIWVDATDGHFVSPGKYAIMEVRETPTKVVCANE